MTGPAITGSNAAMIIIRDYKMDHLISADRGLYRIHTYPYFFMNSTSSFSDKTWNI